MGVVAWDIGQVRTGLDLLCLGALLDAGCEVRGVPGPGLFHYASYEVRLGFEA